MKNKPEDVRNHLVSAMEALNSEDASPEERAVAIERGKALSGLAAAYVNCFKVEIEAVRLIDETGLLPSSMAMPSKCEDKTRGSLAMDPRS
jgi:hypothetical protein